MTRWPEWVPGSRGSGRLGWVWLARLGLAGSAPCLNPGLPAPRQCGSLSGPRSAMITGDSQNAVVCRPYLLRISRDHGRGWPARLAGRPADPPGDVRCAELAMAGRTGYARPVDSLRCRFAAARRLSSVGRATHS